VSVTVADAARNNAALCDAVCAAHGAGGELFDTHWLTRTRTPPRYPNLVTLTDAIDAPLAAIEDLPHGAAVKDSFAVLPLERAGFRFLFTAEWIVRPPMDDVSPNPRWLRIQSDDGLAAWEVAWGESAGEPRVFLPVLLQRRDLVFLARVDDAGTCDAGVIANRTADAIGLSNFFERAPDSARRDAVQAVAHLHPGLPLVGYESGPALAQAHAIGFESLGPLCIWQKD
jgi:hypothetical protein